MQLLLLQFCVIVDTSNIYMRKYYGDEISLKILTHDSISALLNMKKSMVGWILLVFSI